MDCMVCMDVSSVPSTRGGGDPTSSLPSKALWMVLISIQHSSPPKSPRRLRQRMVNPPQDPAFVAETSKEGKEEGKPYVQGAVQGGTPQQGQSTPLVLQDLSKTMGDDDNGKLHVLKRIRFWSI